MGSGPSTSQNTEPYVPIRLESVHRPQQLPSTPIYNRSKTRIINLGLSGIWTNYVPECICPEPRSGHFSVYSEDNSSCYVGLGVNSSNHLLNDVWVLNTVIRKWSKLELSGEIISPRCGSRAVLVNNKIYVFGGFCDEVYYNDLYAIDVVTGEVTRVETNGELPSPRSTPIFFEHKNKLFIWGGYNKKWPLELNILDLETLSWEHLATSVNGRTSIPFVKYNNKVYSYGGSKNGCMLIIDPELKTVSEVPTFGSGPPPGVLGAGMVVVDKYALFFGGKASSKYALLYCCNLEKFCWFNFNVLPDEVTVSKEDGFISEIGLFLLPRLQSYSFVYEPKLREIIGFLGQPFQNPPPLFIVNIEQALSVLHLRDDMSAVVGL